MCDDEAVTAEQPVPPSGTATFLFTDIEGSTRLWEDHPEEMEAAVERHDAILRSVIEDGGGYVFTTAGDAFAAAFARAADAVSTAKLAQDRLSGESWPPSTQIRVRMGLHTGEAQERDGDYFGSALNRAARIMSAGHGGQVLLSAATVAIIDKADVVDLGEHRLKDLAAPERLHQVGAGRFPPLRVLDASLHNLPAARSELIGEAGSRLSSLTPS